MQNPPGKVGTPTLVLPVAPASTIERMSLGVPRSRRGELHQVGLGRSSVLDHCSLDPLHRAGSEAEGLCDFKDARSLGEVASGLPLDCARHLGPPQPLPLRPSAAETGVDALPDHGALELSKSPANLKHQATSRRGRVDRLLVEVQINAARFEVLDGPEQDAGSPAFGGRC